MKEHHRRFTGNCEETQQEINSLIIANGKNNVNVSSVEHLGTSAIDTIMDVWVTIKNQNKDERNSN